MRALLFNLSCFNFTVASKLPRLLRAAGDPDMLFLNEIPAGRGRAIEGALGDEWRGTPSWSGSFFGLKPFQMAIYARGITRVEPLGSLHLGRGRRALLARFERRGSTMLAGVAHLTAEHPFPFGIKQGIR